MHARKHPSLHKRRSGPARLRRFARDEEGAAYTLSFVMVMPILALLMCLIIEAALMLTAKLGTVYAAFAAARSASVWSTATSWDKAEKKAKQSAVNAMVPFASGTQSLFTTAPTNPETVVDGLMYWAAYQAYAKKPVANKYIAAKYGYASRNVEVTLDGPIEKPEDPINVKVTYRFPFNVPGIGRLVGKRGLTGYYFDITSVVTIPNESPRNEERSMGIGYGYFD